MNDSACNRRTTGEEKHEKKSDQSFTRFTLFFFFFAWQPESRLFSEKQKVLFDFS
jgi:hypothetical protein